MEVRPGSIFAGLPNREGLSMKSGMDSEAPENLMRAVRHGRMTAAALSPNHHTIRKMLSNNIEKVNFEWQSSLGDMGKPY